MEELVNEFDSDAMPLQLRFARMILSVTVGFLATEATKKAFTKVVELRTLNK